MNTMRLGLLFGQSVTYSQMKRLAVEAENRGLEAAFTSELNARDAFTPLAALAETTTRLKLGTGIISIYTRSPTIVAMSTATLDEVTGGRAILGLGTSPPFFVKPWHSTPFDQPLRRMREYVTIVRKALAGGTVDHEGKVFNIRDFQLGFNPPRRRIPIYVAAVGPQMIRLAGEIADGVLLSPIITPGYVKKAVKELEVGCKRAGRSLEEVDVACPLITTVADDHEEAVERARSAVAFYAVVYYYKPVMEEADFGTLHEQIREVNKTKGFKQAASVIPDRLVEAFTVCGTPSECRRKMLEYAQSGLKMPLMYPPQTGNVEEAYRIAVHTFSAKEFA